jgi:hypothetical protein
MNTYKFYGNRRSVWDKRDKNTYYLYYFEPEHRLSIIYTSLLVSIVITKKCTDPGSFMQKLMPGDGCVRTFNNPFDLNLMGFSLKEIP